MKKIVTDFYNDIILKKEKVKFSNNKELNNNKVITIYKDKIITKFLGFGSAITESSAYNYSLLNNKLKKEFIKACYSNLGLNYDLGRISIGSNDFSLNSYDYSSKKDLSDFSIIRDYKYIIPMLKDIYKVKKITIMASPWSPPKMFKVFPILNLGIKLKRRYYDNYVTYLDKFITSYRKEGFKLNYLSMQNEPLTRQKWESCMFSLEEQKDFLYNYLNRLDINVLIHDHNKDNLYDITKYLYLDNSNVKGVCFHWYSGPFLDELKKVRENYKDILLINSETCCGFSPYNKLEWVKDGGYYAKDIIDDLNLGVNAYLDWNILLDYNGGPNHKKNYCKSPIILNEDKTNFIKTPIYYYLYHLCKTEGSIVLNNSYDCDLKVLSSIKNNKLVITIYNDSDKEKEYNLKVGNKCIKDKINKKGIITYIE